MRDARSTISGPLAAVGGAVILGACGGGQRQDVSEPRGSFPVAVSAARFPASQRLAEHTHLIISVRNAGQKTIPDIAVTILDPRNGTAAQPFSQDITGGTGERLASRSRPIWIVDRPPGPCRYSCRQGGLGSAVTAYSNTWALGELRPGRTATFEWGLTAVKSGHYTVEYQVAAGLNGKARATDSHGAQPTGRFVVDVRRQPRGAYVNDAGQVVNVG